MSIGRLAGTARGRSRPTLGRLQVAELARALVDRIIADGKDSSLRDVDGETHECIFDGDVKGHRLIVIRPRPTPAVPPLILSPRAREIARMVAKGYPNKTIAAVLEISTWTVGTYLRRIFARLGVGTRAAMVAKLIEQGLLTDRADQAGRIAPGAVGTRDEARE